MLITTKFEQLKGFKVKESGKSYMACCPAHNDTNPSLEIKKTDDGKYSLRCYAGCELEAIIAKLDLDPSLISGDNKIVETYPYQNEIGDILFEVVRKEPKGFFQRRPNGNGGYINDIKGIEPTIYRLPLVIQAIASNDLVIIVEGEKDADNLIKLGFTATTSPMGAGKWQIRYSDLLSGGNVVILPDNDEPGRHHALTVAESLVGRAKSIKILNLPSLPVNGDVSDWIQSGGTKTQLIDFINDSPEYVSSTSCENKSTENEYHDAEKKDSPTKVSSQASQMFSQICMHNFFIDELGESYLHMELNNGQNRFYKIADKSFERFLISKYMQQHHDCPNPEALKKVNMMVDALAHESGEKHNLKYRVAKYEGCLYYDLCRDDWLLVKVTPSGWSLSNKTPILFRRFSNHKPEQVIPSNRGDAKKVYNYILIKESQRFLFLVWLVSCFIEGIEHPISNFHGSQGSSKSTLSRMVKAIVDPSVLEVVSFPKAITEMVQQLSHHWLLCYDNIGNLTDWQSDALCRAVTGDGFSKRKLYTDDEDIIYSFHRCLCLNGINVPSVKADLLDRSILFELDRIPKESMKEKSVLWSEFKNDLPIILGGIFDVLSKAMDIYPTIQLNGLYRMSDFTRWGCAIAEAIQLGGSAEFLKQYGENIETQNEEAISGNPVALAIQHLINQDLMYEGLVKNLHKELKKVAFRNGLDTRSKEWPKNEKALGRRLVTAKANLEQAGIRIEKKKTSAGIWVSIWKADADTVLADVASPETCENNCINCITAESAYISSCIDSDYYEYIEDSLLGISCQCSNTCENNVETALELFENDERFIIND